MSIQSNPRIRITIRQEIPGHRQLQVSKPNISTLDLKLQTYNEKDSRTKNVITSTDARYESLKPQRETLAKRNGRMRQFQREMEVKP